MKIYKWVPISSLDQVSRNHKVYIKVRSNNKYFVVQKKKGKTVADKENGLPRKSGLDSSNSNFGLTEDSNTCELNSYSL